MEALRALWRPRALWDPTQPRMHGGKNHACVEARVAGAMGPHLKIQFCAFQDQLEFPDTAKG